uniref:EGF-like domain-containing protein n=1 Tax=Leptobrachium leishanense TaxID=445787 RepID=A0A8C5PF96_9ANUR
GKSLSCYRGDRTRGKTVEPPAAFTRGGGGARCVCTVTCFLPQGHLPEPTGGFAPRDLPRPGGPVVHVRTFLLLPLHGAFCPRGVISPSPGLICSFPSRRTLPLNLSCPGGRDAWRNVTNTTSSVICHDQSNGCDTAGNLTFMCPESSACAPDGPGFTKCQCAPGYFGYKCLREDGTEEPHRIQMQRLL